MEAHLDLVIASLNAKADRRDELVRYAEAAIRNILIRLDEDLDGTDAEVDAIEVDTRNFANMAVTVSTRDAD